MSSQSLIHRTKELTNLLKPESFINDILNCFRSVHLAIVLLSLLAIGTIIGVVMPQEGMVDLAEIKENYGHNFEFYRTLGLFNVYSSFWFITLEVLFFFNLLIGSFKWLRPAFLAAVQKTFIPADLMLHKPEAHSLPHLTSETREAVENKIISTLKKFRYKTYQDEQGNIYATKGNLTRLGPCIAHFGILVCLIAGVYGSFTGFKAIKMAVPGETFSIREADTLKTNTPESIWMGTIPEWKIKVNDFRVDFYEERPDIAKQYYSDLEVVSPSGKILKEETIYVNHPLLFDNLSVYQASFAPTGRFFLEINGKPQVVEINNQFNQRPISVAPLEDGSTLIMFPFFAQQDPGVTDNYAVFFIRKPGEQFEDGVMPDNIPLLEGKSGTLKGYNITYVKPEISTGLQIKRAPEVPLMYLSYLIISIGTIMCFFSQRQIWVSLKESAPGKTAVMMHPRTNKARISFRQELATLQTALNNVLAPKQPIKESGL